MVCTFLFLDISKRTQITFKKASNKRQKEKRKSQELETKSQEQSRGYKSYRVIGEPRHGINKAKNAHSCENELINKRNLRERFYNIIIEKILS